MTKRILDEGPGGQALGAHPTIFRRVQVELTQAPLAEIEADLHALPRTKAERPLPAELAEAAGADEVSADFRSTTLLRPGKPARLLVVGLGDLASLDGERLRVCAALAVAEARKLKASSIAWRLPVKGDDSGSRQAVSDLVSGTILASYRFDRFKTSKADKRPPEIERLVISIAGTVDAPLRREAEVARVASEAANRARELQQLPGNLVTPTYLADRAREIAAEYPSLECRLIDKREMEHLGMGGMLAVSSGSEQDPYVIALRHSPKGVEGETLGLVGKGVTFDSGGISIKPSAAMHEMKMDMSGAASVLEATAAIAELSLPINTLTVIPAAENMPSGDATRPGDVITQMNGKTVEVINTDAEGRLILADALTWAVREGADRIVDLATLTGAVLVALGSTYAALIANDDELAAEVEEAAEKTGELAWRLPLHQEYKELTKGSDTDLKNASDKRKAGTIYAASFLEEFVDGKPWVHLDIAGTAWGVGRAYVGEGATGYGVRLLVELAREMSAGG